MEKCPVCMAVYGGKDSCHRCKSDLRGFAAMEKEARAQFSLAVTAFKQGDYSAAFDHSRRSCWLKHSKEAQRICMHAANLGRL